MKAIICSTIKNEEKNLNSFFKVLDKIIKTFDDYFIILVESDSVDNTYNKAQQMLSNYKGSVIKIETDYLKLRTEKISLCRNSYLQLIKENKSLANFDFMIVADADNVNKNLNKLSILNSIKAAPKDWVGIFANQKYLYYDLWPLRIKTLLDKDCYQEFIKYSYKISIRRAYFSTVFKNFFIIKKINERFIKVNSAFGGLGIYKLREVLGSRYDSNLGKFSEHVRFNENILKNNLNKSLYIDKKLINFSGLNEHFFKGIIYCISNYFSSNLLNKFKKINSKS